MLCCEMGIHCTHFLELGEEGVWPGFNPLENKRAKPQRRTKFHRCNCLGRSASH